MKTVDFRRKMDVRTLPWDPPEEGPDEHDMSTAEMNVLTKTRKGNETNNNEKSDRKMKECKN